METVKISQLPLATQSLDGDEYIIVQEGSSKKIRRSQIIKVPLPIAEGGTGKTTRQEAIDSLTAVAEASVGHVLTKGSDGHAVFRGIPTVVPADSVVKETMFGQPHAPGVSVKFSREDHTHGTPPNPVPAHAVITSLVHNFDADGNAPAQIHGSEKHVGIIGTKDQVGLGNVTNDAQVKRVEVGMPNGVASLDSNGKIPTAQLSPLAITSVFTVPSEIAQLALDAQEGDVAVRSDENKSYIHNGGTSGTMADWTLLRTPTDLVLSVFGRTGAISAAANDYTWAQIDKTVSDIVDITNRSHTSLTDIGVNSHVAIDSHIANTNNPHVTTAAQVGAIAKVEDDIAPKLGGNLSAQNRDIIKIRTAVFNAEYDNGASGAAITIDWNSGQVQKLTLTADCVLSFSAPVGPCWCTLSLIQDAVGGRVVTWPANVRWPSDSAPTLTVGANRVDMIEFFYTGSVYRGIAALNYSD